MTPPFRYRLRVRYAECDAQKVVFNANYGLYIDVAILEFVRTLGLTERLTAAQLDFQLVNQTLEWAAPARFDDVVEIAVRVGRVGTTSFTLVTDFRIAGHEAVIATGETVYVLVDEPTLAKTAVPDDVRALLERGAPGLLVDHADSTARAPER